jgi:hypothetical protein
MEDDPDLELAPQPVQKVRVENVPDPGGGAAPGYLVVHGTDIEGQNIVDAQIREVMDQAMPDLTARAGHQDHRLARHADPLPGPRESKPGATPEPRGFVQLRKIRGVAPGTLPPQAGSHRPTECFADHFVAAIGGRSVGCGAGIVLALIWTKVTPRTIR